MESNVSEPAAQGLPFRVLNCPSGPGLGQQQLRSHRMSRENLPWETIFQPSPGLRGSLGPLMERGSYTSPRGKRWGRSSCLAGWPSPSSLEEARLKSLAGLLRGIWLWGPLRTGESISFHPLQVRDTCREELSGRPSSTLSAARDSCGEIKGKHSFVT